MGLPLIDCSSRAYSNADFESSNHFALTQLLFPVYAGGSAAVCNRPNHWDNRHGVHHHWHDFIRPKSARAAIRRVERAVKK